jgi:hypothetical protein
VVGAGHALPASVPARKPQADRISKPGLVDAATGSEAPGDVVSRGRRPGTRSALDLRVPDFTTPLLF